ncbi:MAG: hypothetical protein KGH60_04230 [Candidatus Micrarchaeota archaeon]|nr:hypothetical protein [Candidatus Micrarchaeota archaeon]
MRAQTSLEFTIITGAAAAFSLFVIGIFANVLHGQHSLLSNALNQSAPSGLLATNSTGSQSQAQYLYAKLIRSNESVSYPLSGYSNVQNVSEYSHCSWYSFMGSQTPVKDQCSVPGWGYWIPSGRCYESATYCISLRNLTGRVSQIQSRYGYLYNITVDVYGQGPQLSAILSSSRQGSTLMGQNGTIVGNAIVSYVSGQGPQPYYSYSVLNSSGTRLVNESAYTEYIQALGALEATLSNYNGTPIDPDIQSIINQSIEAFDEASARLLSAQTAAQGQCAINTTANASAVTCRPLSPFYYTINETLFPQIYVPNQIVLVQGSTVSIT